ncbi:MAG: hypothetical protein CMG71_01020 [Candidatus Marinimicrobia bacterium]|nr:hypothetical protein [Candidatus Neomarinimicrobiota bacterium]|tara:strand:+ start:74742 stop:76025 length:1284 start_codon:yes stop_codon:yes gene_type:complete
MARVISIEHLYKEYRLGVIGHGTLYQDLQSWWARMRGKEDPNSIIGHQNHRSRKDRMLALDDINLDIEDGEVLGIIGRNGAGKSTLLKILSRVTAPSSGTVKVKGQLASLLEVGTGFHPELTGRENIYLNGAINGMDRAEVTRKLDEIVDFAGIEKFLDTPVKRYSSGMYVRLGFSVAAHLESDILVVDEVLAVGDIQFQEKAIGKMREVSTTGGRTVLFVSHNMLSIKLLCTNCILLSEGEITHIGQPETVIAHYAGLKKKTLSQPNREFAEESSKKMKIRSIKVVDNLNRPSSQLEQTEPFKIEISYDINEKVKVYYVNIQLFSGEFLRVEQSKYLVQEFDDPGSYSVTVEFPGGILSCGIYGFCVGLVTELGKEIIDIYDVREEENPIWFSLVDTSNKITDNNAILSMDLKWSLREDVDKVKFD